MPDPQALDTSSSPWVFPGQQGDSPPAAPPGALNTGAPPVTPGVIPVQGQGQQQPAQPPAPAFDDEGQYRQAEQIEEDSYAKNLLDASGRRPLLGQLERHPEQDKLDEAKELFGQITDPKQRRMFEPQIRQLQARIDRDLKAQELRAKEQRRDQLHQIDAPRETVKARADTANVMSSEIDNIAAGITANRTSRDPKTARQADYDTVTSPLSTMSKQKPDGTVSYEPLRNVAASIATYNRLPSNDLAVQYALTMGSPVGTDEKGQPLPGYNGVKGKGATNYKVLGRDARDNYLVEMPDQKVLRVDPYTFNQLRRARAAGYKAAQQWEKDQQEKNKPGIVTKIMQAVIPEKGF